MSFRLSVNLALILKNIDSNNCTLILFGRKKKKDRLCFFFWFFKKKADSQVGQIFTGKKKDDGGKERGKKKLHRHAENTNMNTRPKLYTPTIKGQIEFVSDRVHE